VASDRAWDGVRDLSGEGLAVPGQSGVLVKRTAAAVLGAGICLQ